MLDPLRSYYYSRYGLAEVLATRFDAHTAADVPAILDGLTEDDLKDALEARIRALLREIRVYFPEPSYPAKVDVSGTLVREPDGSKGAQVAAEGYYVRPHVMVSDGALNGRYGFLNTPLPSRDVLQRYYPPASRLSIGKASASNIKKDRLFVLACTVATLTPLKAARRSGESDRAAIFPDLPLGDLVTYIDLYRDMLPSLPAPTLARTNEEGKPYLRQNWGTFPDAPPSWSFGALGVVAGIGSWARQSGFFDDAAPVLDALATGRVYVIDTGGSSRVETAGSHIAALAKTGVLRDVLDRAYLIETSVSDDTLHRVLRRFLLRFTDPYVRDFLSVRARYPSAFRSLFNHYFMSDYPQSLIESARIAAQHINDQAWFATDANNSADTRRTNKQTILAGLESLLYDCDSGAEMIARISVQVGRLTGRDFPAEAQAFFDAAMDEDGLSVEEARRLLVAYMRLRQPAADSDAEPSDRQEPTPESVTAPQETPDAPTGPADASPDTPTLFDADDALSDLP